jgi:transcription elongation factor Elf1
MNNFEKLKAMTVGELADWLDKYGQFDGSPWMDWFNENYCSKCESVKCKVDEKAAFFPGHTIDCAYCELEHKCKFFPALKDVPDNKMTIEMWLNEEV